jgi:hypothetical protein
LLADDYERYRIAVRRADRALCDAARALAVDDALAPLETIERALADSLEAASVAGTSLYSILTPVQYALLESALHPRATTAGALLRGLWLRHRELEQEAVEAAGEGEGAARAPCSTSSGPPPSPRVAVVPPAGGSR